jgi:hypothetical protein
MENSNSIIVEGMGNEALKENSIGKKSVYDIIPRNQRSNPNGFRLLGKLKLLQQQLNNNLTQQAIALASYQHPRIAREQYVSEIPLRHKKVHCYFL